MGAYRRFHVHLVYVYSTPVTMPLLSLAILLVCCMACIVVVCCHMFGMLRACELWEYSYDSRQYITQTITTIALLLHAHDLLGTLSCNVVRFRLACIYGGQSFGASSHIQYNTACRSWPCLPNDTNA